MVCWEKTPVQQKWKQTGTDIESLKRRVILGKSQFQSGKPEENVAKPQKWILLLLPKWGDNLNALLEGNILNDWEKS